MNDSFRAFRVHEEGGGVRRGVERLSLDALPAGEVDVRVRFSSLNYKDALSASGNRGVTKRYPHTPGIDAAGEVVASDDDRFAPGDEVIVTSYDLGVDTPGGFGERIRVPAAWVVPLPDGLSAREAMTLGTAGLTAGLAVDALERHGVAPEGGPVVVTGASGGVGSVAVALLARLGYEVVASSGSEGAHDLLRALGAERVVPREALVDEGDRPLLGGAYAAGVDAVGGRTLATLVRSLRRDGAVAACGLVGGADLALTVFPFILRGVALLGVDSAECPMPRRRRVWERFADAWRLDLAPLVTEVGLDDLDDAVAAILAGETTGRILVRVAEDGRTGR